MSMTIGPACPDDIPALHALIEAAYRGDTARRGWTHEADLLGGQRTDAAALSDYIAHPGQHLLAAREAGRLTGCVLVIALADARGYLGLLTVDPALQAGGQGRLLVTAAEDTARGFNADVMEMTVIARRVELIAWYIRLGYRMTGETRPFPYDDARFGLPRVGDLDFAVLEKRLVEPLSV